MFFIFANRVFAPMIERILLIQQGSSWGGVRVGTCSPHRRPQSRRARTPLPIVAK